MGQTQSQESPQLHSSRFQNYRPHNYPESPHQANSNSRAQPQRLPRLEHEGILKIRSTPFPNSVQITNQGSLLFLQNAQTTLQQLLSSRLYTNRLFPVQDISRLIENVLYTLAFLAESQVTYKDLSAQNIYYSDSQFKLLPNELIEKRFYEKAYTEFYRNHSVEEPLPLLSPELIIALRMKEANVQDHQIVNKSIVFIFGLILLEVTTLLPSYECFDSNYDIFNNIITERLSLVEDHYNECIARIIANMLDYDFHERMDLKELSIWVNRELIQQKHSIVSSKSDSLAEDCPVSKSKSKASAKKRKLMDSHGEQTISRQDPINQVSCKSYCRTNIAYINGYQQENGPDCYPDPRNGYKNCVILGNVQYLDEQSKGKDKEMQNQQTPEMKTRKARAPKAPPSCDDQKNERSSNSRRFGYQKEEGYRNYAEKSKRNKVYVRNQEATEEYPAVQSKLRDVGNLRTHSYVQQIGLKKSYDNLKDPKPNRQAARNQNKYYPSLSDIQNIHQSTSTRTIVKHNEVGRVQETQYIKRSGSHNLQQHEDGNEKYEKGYERDRHKYRDRETFDSKQSRQSDSKRSANDGSINRIKLEIQKSRKLIEEFRKCEGISP